MHAGHHFPPIGGSWVIALIVALIAALIYRQWNADKSSCVVTAHG